jgi:hypothetical protein
MAAAKKTKTKTKTTAATKSSSELLEKYRAPAMKLKPDAVQVCRADTRIAFANVKQGVESLFGPEGARDREARIAAVQEQLPKLNAKKAAKRLDLARALMLAAQQVALPVSTGEINENLAIVSKHRDPILTTAEVLAAKGILPREEVAKIRAGTGKYDIASDGIALADLFAAHADTVKGKHAFTDQDFAEMREAAEWLLDHLTPTGAKKTPSAKSDAADLRDRLWTLLVAGHSDLRVMGYVMFRDDFDTKVPKLQSQTTTAPKEPETAPADSGETKPGDGKADE